MFMKSSNSRKIDTYFHIKWCLAVAGNQKHTRSETYSKPRAKPTSPLQPSAYPKEIQVLNKQIQGSQPTWRPARKKAHEQSKTAIATLRCFTT